MPPQAPTIYIRYGNQRVATIDEHRFLYDRAWQNKSDAFPLSQNLDLYALEHERETAWRWLVNLLPEGPSRQRIARRLQISSENDFALLVALGKDCAGAITLHTRADEPSAPWQPTDEWAPYKILEPSILEDMATTAGTVATLFDNDVRLSLAGARDKIAVRKGPEEQLFLPLHGAPSTHLLKCPSPSYSNLIDNEYLCLELARAVGLPVVNAQLFGVRSKYLLLIERFDRSPVYEPTTFPPHEESSDQLYYHPSLSRLHQEDFAQALDRPHDQKYESEGGPNFAECLALIRNTAKTPLEEINPLMRWFVYCLVIGNRDNHAKNLARLWTGRHWRLAPFYDLVCTTAYGNLSQSLAMSIGETRDASRLCRATWSKHARQCKIGLRPWIRVVDEICTLVHEQLPSIAEKVADSLGADRLGDFRRAIQKGIRNTQRSIQS